MSPPARTEFSATVTDIQLESRDDSGVRWRMTLSHTAFTPGDTGTLEAISRSGTRIVLPVLHVLAVQSGEIWHIVEKPLAAGTNVSGRLNP